MNFSIALLSFVVEGMTKFSSSLLTFIFFVKTFYIVKLQIYFVFLFPTRRDKTETFQVYHWNGIAMSFQEMQFRQNLVYSEIESKVDSYIIQFKVGAHLDEPVMVHTLLTLKCASWQCAVCTNVHRTWIANCLKFLLHSIEIWKPIRHYRSVQTKFNFKLPCIDRSFSVLSHIAVLYLEANFRKNRITKLYFGLLFNKNSVKSRQLFKECCCDMISRIFFKLDFHTILWKNEKYTLTTIFSVKPTL